MPQMKNALEKAVTLAAALQSLDTLRSYLEAAGCESYERFYSLMDQVHEIGL